MDHRNELAKVGKVLFLGNSITWHGPSKEVDWSGNWGMAASATANDYVHVLVRSLGELMGREPEFRAHNIADFERGYMTCDVEAFFKKPLAFQPDLVVVAIGENVPDFPDEPARAKFKDQMLRLLTLIKDHGRAILIVRSSFWPAAAKDEILRQTCEAVGGIFVDIGCLSRNEANYARSERSYTHAGVAAHPGDRGMKAIADELLTAIRNHT